MAQVAQRDVISLLIQDHREVDELLVRLEELADDEPVGTDVEARTVAGQVVAELAERWADLSALDLLDPA